MTFLFAYSAAPARRAALCALALLVLALGSTAVASAADGPAGTVVVQQVGIGGSAAPGGCYSITRVDGTDPGFWGYRCDRSDDAGTDGRVVAELPVGTYRMEEDEPPAAFKQAPGAFSVLVREGETVTVTRTHEPLPPLRVVTNDQDGKPLAGSCWRIHLPGEYEGYIAEACDDDDGANDGTTTFTTIRPGGYEIRHMESPSPYHRLDDVTPFAMPDAEKTLTFTLEREIAPVNTAPPTVTGQAKVGETLAGGRGTWTGTYIDFIDSWQRCDAAGASCTTIPNTIGQSQYTLTADDLGKTLRFAVSARNEAGRAIAVSAPVDVLSLEAPANTSRPTITGAVEPGQRLIGNAGTWTGAPTFAYQWQRCGGDGTSCTNVDRATGPTYALTTGDAGFRMRLVVTATNGAGSASAASDATPLPNVGPRNQEQPVIRGNAEVGEQLTAYPGWWISHYGALQFDYHWLRCKPADANDCIAIDATGDVYTVTPADQGSRIRIDVTGTDAGGSATARSNPTLAVPSAYPVNTLAPYIVGDPVILTKLVANAGVWMSNYGTIELEYYWDRCDADGNNCGYLHTGRNHTASAKDVGHVLRVMVFASNDKGTSMAVARTAVIHSVPPVNGGIGPAIAGDAVLAERLTVSAGLWTSPYGDKITVNYYWSRCDANGAACDYLHTGRNHTVETADLGGHILRVMVSVETEHGVAIAYTQTALVRAVPPVNGGIGPAIAGDAVLAERLSASAGLWTSPYGDRITVNYYWSRCDANGNACDYLHTGRNHTVETDDLGGHILKVMVSVETDHGVAIAYTQTALVRAVPPVNVTAPSITRQGSKLTVNPGTWTNPYPGGITFNYYWSRCDANGSSCDYLHTGASHTLGRDDVGHVMKVMLSVETSHGVAIRYVQSAVVS